MPLGPPRRKVLATPLTIGCETRDREVAGSTSGRALLRNNLGQVVHTSVCPLESSI